MTNTDNNTTDAPAEAVWIPTSNGPAVRLDADVAEQITTRGYALHWNSNGHGGSYVRVYRGPSKGGVQEHPAPIKRVSRSITPNHTTLARFIARPAPGQFVRHRHGDPSDLRRESLVVAGAGQ